MIGTAMQLLDLLRERGFVPDEGGAPWFDLPVGNGKVRVHLDDVMVDIWVMTGNGVIEWDMRLSHAPLSVVSAVIDLALAASGDSTGEAQQS